MGKKYLDTKKNTLEASILDVWKEAAKLNEYKTKLGEKKRVAGGDMRRTENKKLKEEVELDETTKFSNADFMLGFLVPWAMNPTTKYEPHLVNYVKKLIPANNREYAYSMIAQQLTKLIQGGMPAVKNFARQNKGAYDKMDKDVKKHLMKGMKEEAELDEKLDKEDEPTIKKVVKMLKKASGAHAGQAKDLEKAMTEEDEIDEGKMSQLHQLMKDGKSAKEIAKIMKLDVKTIQALMDEKSELEENLDGRTREYRQHRERLESMRLKRQEARHVDPADIDTSATDDDIKAADKNIMMQMRKSVSLRGQFPVEFLDKKKVKKPQKIA